MPELKSQEPSNVGRREFLRLGMAAAVTAVVPMPSFAAPAAAVGAASAPRVLSFFNTHSGERLQTAYCCAGTYDPEALKNINYILRDVRANAIKPIDTRLLDLLDELSGALGTDAPYHVISGYRSPATNEMLRARGGAQTGVATRSLHMVGQAVDVRVPGVKLAHLREAAVSLKRGGVGYYPGPDFVHVDVGRIRTW